MGEEGGVIGGRYFHISSPSFSFEAVAVIQYVYHSADLVQELSDSLNVFVEVDVP